jgi:hypothetical protein
MLFEDDPTFRPFLERGSVVILSDFLSDTPEIQFVPTRHFSAYKLRVVPCLAATVSMNSGQFLT